MLPSSPFTMLKLSKTTSPNKLLHNDCVTLYTASWFWVTLYPNTYTQTTMRNLPMYAKTIERPKKCVRIPTMGVRIAYIVLGLL